MAILLPNGKQSFTGVLGLPLSGGKVYTYAAGTNTPQATYADAAGTIPNTNPVILDARGEATIFWNGAYKAVLRDALDVIIWTVDNITTIDPLAAQVASLFGAGGSALVGYQPPGGSVVARNVQAKLRERLSFEDLGAVGDGVTDDQPALQAAIEARYGLIGNVGQIPYFVEIHGTPGKTYKFANPLLVRQSHLLFIGDGATIVCTGGSAFWFTPQGVPNFVEWCAVKNWKITGATFAAIRCDPGTPFLKIEDNWITGNVNGMYLCVIEARISGNYVRDNTGVGLYLVARQVQGAGIYHESQRCVITDNMFWTNTQGGVQFENGGCHYFGFNDLEANGNTNPELLLRNSFGNQIHALYTEPAAGCPAVILLDNASALVAGRVCEGNKITDGTFGGGATWDIQFNASSGALVDGMRYGTGNIYIAAACNGVKLMPGTSTPIVTNLGSRTLDFSQPGRLAMSESTYRRAVLDATDALGGKMGAEDASMHLFGITGLSQSGTVLSKNLTGTVDITGAVTTGAVVFPTAEVDASYRLFLTTQPIGGAPAAGSLRASWTSPTAAGFTATLEVAPGVGNTVRVHWLLIRI